MEQLPNELYERAEDQFVDVDAAEKPDDYFYIAGSSTQISRVHHIERAAIVSLLRVIYGNFGELT